MLTAAGRVFAHAGRLYAEHLALIEAVAKRAEHWRTHEIRLPHGVRVEPMHDEYDRLVYAIDWGRDPPPAPPTFLLDRVLAVEVAWTAFMLRRPWAIDDERLQTSSPGRSRLSASRCVPLFWPSERRSFTGPRPCSCRLGSSGGPGRPYSPCSRSPGRAATYVR